MGPGHPSGAHVPSGASDDGPLSCAPWPLTRRTTSSVRRTPSRPSTWARTRRARSHATLVHRPAPEPTDRAVLHVHGFADYFFHTEYAEWWNARGHDFYALDLRKYGRSLREHQTPNYVEDLREYFPDLDAAWGRVAVEPHPDRHDRPLHRWPDPAAVAARPTARRPGRRRPQLPVVRPAGQRVAAQPRRAPGARPDGRPAAAPPDPPQGQRRLHPVAAPRPPRRVRLQPRLEARRVLPRVRRVVARRAPRPRRAAPRARRPRPVPGALLDDVARGPRRWARPCTATTSCWTSSRSAAGPPAWAATSPASPWTVRATTWCCRCPTSRARVYDEIDRWLSTYVDG